MNAQKIKLFLLFLAGALVGMAGTYFFKTYTIEKRNDIAQTATTTKTRVNSEDNQDETRQGSSKKIDELTQEETVINFVKQNHQLPDYYITKSTAKSKGWIPSKGNLCDVLPGKAIGGDRFSNREKKLPKGENYFEADINYNCGNRGAARIVFTKNGDVWVTHNHYKTFEKH